ncbi:hypothetical protein [Salibacterium halotolerans]|uniref:Uncharacterized protein n=1 Tax=Salibacterium halotolerans TaxID=1884432 RepID=A0A1I5PHQ8_9BACI|nr:hypothetical protein [Salibacterium halotolerans]SFP33387.1 hypothetical protein SAMN05518683_104126 [Salibacterium halotolerans]
MVFAYLLIVNPLLFFAAGILMGMFLPLKNSAVRVTTALIPVHGLSFAVMIGWQQMSFAAAHLVYGT